MKEMGSRANTQPFGIKCTYTMSRNEILIVAGKTDTLIDIIRIHSNLSLEVN